MFIIKTQVEKRAGLKYRDQILISSTGIQLKESDTNITEIHDTLVLFNRQLLQDPACIQQLASTIPQATQSLIETDAIPSLKTLESCIELYESQDNQTALFDMIHRILQVKKSFDMILIKFNCDFIVDLCESFRREINCH